MTTNIDEIHTEPALDILDQEISEPFIFRSGGLFGIGKKARTIRSAIRYIDRHPEEGIFHLENGTLAAWLADQQADDLAQLAREVVRQRGNDARAMLEKFLIGSGVVKRPRLVINPRRMPTAYVLAGEKLEIPLQIRKGRGRGYLFGELQPEDSWIRIEPMQFSGDKTDVTVTLDASVLPINETPRQTNIHIIGSHSAEPTRLPVQYKVVGEPAAFTRWVLRPLSSFLFASVLGVIIGLLLTYSGAPLPDWQLWEELLSPALMWAVPVGLLWGLIGSVCGFFFPRARPTSVDIAQFFKHILVWSISLAAAAAIVFLAWRNIEHVSPPFYGLSLQTVMLFAASLAIIPAAVQEIRASRSAEKHSSAGANRFMWEPVLLILIAGIIAVLAIDIDSVGQQAKTYVEKEEIVTEVQDWARSESQLVEQQLNDWIDQAILRYYDRRAPSRSEISVED